MNKFVWGLAINQLMAFIFYEDIKLLGWWMSFVIGMVRLWWNGESALGTHAWGGVSSAWGKNFSGKTVWHVVHCKMRCSLPTGNTGRKNTDT